MNIDFYQVLGVQETASQDEIKKAYRKLAAQHHPDKGGDTAKFQEIAQAYDTLGDEVKRGQYNAQRNGREEFHFTSGNINDIFNQMFGGHHPFSNAFRNQSQHPHRKNRSLNIKISITLNQSYTGTDLEASYQTPGGKKETVSIKVPPGIQSGQTIRYPELGDDSDPNLPRGDLNVVVTIAQCQNFARRGDDLIACVLISPIEAMIGCTKIIENLDGEEIKIIIRPGVQHGTEYLTRGLGFTNLRGYKGNLITVIGIEVPAITDPKLKEKLEQLYAEISSPQ